MDAELVVQRRGDGVWVVILAREGTPPMEFLCETQQQAQAFAASLTSAKKTYRSLTRKPIEKPQPKRSVFGRLVGV